MIGFSTVLKNMEKSLKYLTIVFACVGGYRVLNDHSETKKLKLTNDKNVYHSPNSTGDSIRSEKDQQADFSNINGFRSSALKKIHPFIYPKQFNTLDAITTTALNLTPIASKHNLSHFPIKVIREQNDEQYSPYDQTGNGYGDMIPIKADIHDFPMKHGGPALFGYDSDGLYPPYTPAYSNHLNLNGLNPLNGIKNCLNGILPPVDSLLVLGILGFLMYVISTIVNLVNRVSLPLLSDQTSGTMTAATAAMVAATKLAKPITQRHFSDDQQSNLLRHFEHILRMAIEMHEGSIRAI